MSPSFNDYVLKRITAPADLLTLVEAKQHLRVDHSDEDTLITALISSVSDALDGPDGKCGHALVPQNWRMLTTGTTSDGLVWLPICPAASLVQIQYYDKANVLQTANINNYDLIAGDEWAYIVPKSNVWPAFYGRYDALQVTWTAGYGAISAVPMSIIAAAKLMLGHLYSNREAVVTSMTVNELPMAVEALLGLTRRGFIDA